MHLLPFSSCAKNSSGDFASIHKVNIDLFELHCIIMMFVAWKVKKGREINASVGSNRSIETAVRDHGKILFSTVKNVTFSGSGNFSDNRKTSGPNKSVPLKTVHFCKICKSVDLEDTTPKPYQQCSDPYTCFGWLSYPNTAYL